MKQQLIFGVLALTLALAGSSAHAFNTPSFATAQQQCYGVAMVGFDSVINSRMGVPPEHALELASVRQYTAHDSGPVVDVADIYGAYLLKVILSAYLWEENPHSYAVDVFYRCARDRHQVQQAQAQR